MGKPELKFEGSKMIASYDLDPNGDGQPVVKSYVEVDLAEVPDEVLDAIAKKKAEKA